MRDMLLRMAHKVETRREPDFVIGGREDPYLRRWWLIPVNRFFNIYLHQFLKSDDDRALHDHPWWNLSFLLEGEYIEHTIDAGGVHKRQRRVAGQCKLRRASSAHRIEIEGNPCWTLFITGPRVRYWGFHCPQGWRYWRDFVANGDKGSIGKGCD